MKKHQPFTRESLLEEYVTKGYINWPRMLATAEALDEALLTIKLMEAELEAARNAPPSEVAAFEFKPATASSDDSEEDITLDTAAKMLGVARRSVERWEREGKVTLIRKDGRVFMGGAEFDRVVAWRESLA